MNKWKHVTVFIAFIGCVVSLIFFIKTKHAILLFLSVFSLGYFVAELIKSIKDVNKIGTNDVVMFVLTILISSFPTLISMNNPPFVSQLNRLYSPKDSVVFKNEIFIDSASSPKMIFAFDNSGDALNDKIDTSLNDKYKEYCRDVFDFLGGKIVEKEKEQILGKPKITYGDFLKMRACFDLTKISEKKGQFIILRIGEDKRKYNDRMKKLGRKYYEQMERFENIDKGILQDEILKIFKTLNDEIDTRFDTFIAELETLFFKNGITPEENKENKENGKLSECVVYIYSDFYHDYDKSEETKKEIEKIINEKKKLLVGIVQNCFIDQHHRNKSRLGMSILEEYLNTTSDEETYFFIDSINKATIVPIRIVEAKNQYWFYSDKHDTEISTYFRIVFDDNDKYCIRLVNDVKGLSIDGVEMKLKEERCCESKNDNKNSFVLKYYGKKPVQNPRFEIMHDDIHYFVDCKFIEEWDRNFKWIIPLILGLIGFGIGSWKN